MANERTFSIIKPDATLANNTGGINKLIEEAGLKIIAQRRIQMTRNQAERFYSVHVERPFFEELVDFMISAPVVVQVLEGENAIFKYRESWGLPIQLKLLMVLFEKCMQRVWEKTLFMGPTLLRLLQKKYLSSLASQI
jgi:hypothetical protein